jgi:hypothetical protein
MAEADKKIISDAQRHEIEKTLPAAFAALAPADRADFWNKLEQIKRAETPPEKLAVQCEAAARQLEEHASRLPGGAVAAMQSSDVLRKFAATCRQISKAGGSRFLRQCQLLWPWEMLGGDLGISNPPRRRRDEATWPLPTGPVIAYFQATAKAVFAETPGPNQIRKVVARYSRDFSPAIRAAYNAGLLRTVFDIPFDDDRKVRVSIDESKIYILRDGKLIDKDGNIVGGVG